MAVVLPEATVFVVGLSVSLVSPHAVTINVLLVDVAVLALGVVSVAVTVKV